METIKPIADIERSKRNLFTRAVAEALGHEIPARDVADVLCLLVSLATLLVFLPVVSFDFVNYDDPSYVTGNPHVATGISIANIRWAFTSLHGGISYWHPLTWLSHQLDCQIFGPRPGAHHLMNVLLHLANSILIFRGIYRFSHSPGAAGMIAALFALHPANVESVAWIAERKNLLSTFFFLLTIGSYFSWLESRSMRRYARILLLYTLALLSKPTAVTLPFALLLLDFWPIQRLGATQRDFRWCALWACIHEKIPLFVMSVALSALTFHAQREVGTVHSLDTLPLASRIDNAFVATFHYLQTLTWPENMCVLYYHPGTWPGSLVQISALVFYSLCIAAVWLRRRRPWFFVAWFWFLGTLLPTIGLVQVGAQAFADRYTYIPYIGLFVGITCLGRTCASRFPSKIVRPLLFGAGCIPLAALSICSMRQLRHWQNSYALFAQALKVDPKNPIAHNNFASELERQGETAAAIEHFQAAMDLQPALVSPALAIGNLLLKSNELAKAAVYFARGTRSERAEATEQAFIGLAYVLNATGNTGKAIENYEHALRLEPDLLVANYNLASILATHFDPKFRDGKRAVSLAKRACSLSGASPMCLSTLAAAYAEAGRFQDAIKTGETALRIARQWRRAALVADIERRLQLFRDLKPYRIQRDSANAPLWQSVTPTADLNQNSER